VLDPEMIADTVKIVNEAQKDKVQVNLIINNRAGDIPWSEDSFQPQMGS